MKKEGKIVASGSYTLDSSTILWARTRVQQIDEAETEIGCAIERLMGIPGDLRGSAILMDNQPESDMMRSFADDAERLVNDLQSRFRGMLTDRGKLRVAIRRWEGNNHDDT